MHDPQSRNVEFARIGPSLARSRGTGREEAEPGGGQCATAKRRRLNRHGHWQRPEIGRCPAGAILIPVHRGVCAPGPGHVAAGIVHGYW